MAHFGNIICVENGPYIHGNDTLFPGLLLFEQVKLLVHRQCGLVADAILVLEQFPQPDISLL